MSVRLYWWRYGVWQRFGKPLKELEFDWNHPGYADLLSGRQPRRVDTRSERVCRFLDAISSNWFHD